MDASAEDPIHFMMKTTVKWIIEIQIYNYDHPVHRRETTHRVLAIIDHKDGTNLSTTQKQFIHYIINYIINNGTYSEEMLHNISSIIKEDDMDSNNIKKHFFTDHPEDLPLLLNMIYTAIKIEDEDDIKKADAKAGEAKTGAVDAKSLYRFALRSDSSMITCTKHTDIEIDPRRTFDERKYVLSAGE